jgi:hypothetical protein
MKEGFLQTTEGCPSRPYPLAITALSKYIIKKLFPIRRSRRRSTLNKVRTEQNRTRREASGGKGEEIKDRHDDRWIKKMKGRQIEINDK